MTVCHVKKALATPHRSKLKKKALLVYILLTTALFENQPKKRLEWISKENRTILVPAAATARKVITTMKHIA